MKILLVALVALALVACGETTRVVKESTRTITQTRSVTIDVSKPVVYVDTGATDGLVYRPDGMSYYGGHQEIVHIHWLSYGGPVAHARAQYGYDTCVPDCARGRYTFRPIKVELSDRGLCHGVIAYRVWVLHGAGLNPTPHAIASPDGPPCP